MNVRTGLILEVLFLCGGALLTPLRAQSVSPQGTFDGRSVEDATVVNGQTCTNPAVGFSYAFPAGTRVEDGRAARLEESRVDLEARGIQPEASYFLWGYGETRTVAHLCIGERAPLKIAIMVFPEAELSQLGSDPVQGISDSLAQSAGLPHGTPARLTVAGHSFQSDLSEGTVQFGNQNKTAFVAMYGTRVNSYYVMWEVAGEQASVLGEVKDSLASLVVTAPVTPATAAAGPTLKPEVAEEFRNRLNAFMVAWLTTRSEAATLSFVDQSAFKAPAIIGSYCDGWYKTGMPTGSVRSYVTSNLMGVPNGFPIGTAATKIFGAWDRLPPEWLNAAANDPSTEHFLVAEIDQQTLPLLFRDRFANSAYAQYLAGQVDKEGHLYWVVFPEMQPDGDIFVIFTVWERFRGTWSIAGFDIVCQ